MKIRSSHSNAPLQPFNIFRITSVIESALISTTNFRHEFSCLKLEINNIPNAWIAWKYCTGLAAFAKIGEKKKVGPVVCILCGGSLRWQLHLFMGFSCLMPLKAQANSTLGCVTSGLKPDYCHLMMWMNLSRKMPVECLKGQTAGASSSSQAEWREWLLRNAYVVKCRQNCAGIVTYHSKVRSWGRRPMSPTWQENILVVEKPIRFRSICNSMFSVLFRALISHRMIQVSKNVILICTRLWTPWGQGSA